MKMQEKTGRSSKKGRCCIKTKFSNLDGKNNDLKFCLAIVVEGGFKAESLKIFFFFLSRHHLQIVTQMCGLFSGESSGK